MKKSGATGEIKSSKVVEVGEDEYDYERINYKSGGEIKQWYKEGSSKWGLDKTEIEIEEKNKLFTLTKPHFVEMRKWVGDFDTLDTAKKKGEEIAKREEKYKSGGEIKQGGGGGLMVFFGILGTLVLASIGIKK